MIPTWRLAGLMAVEIFFGVAAWISPEFLPSAVIWPLLAFGAGLVDWFRAQPVQALSVRRIHPADWRVDKPSAVRLDFVNASAQTQVVRFADTLPPDFNAEPDAETEGVLRLEPNKDATISYSAVPRRRGATEFGDCTVCLRGPWGLMWRVGRLPLREEVRVLPNITRAWKTLQSSFINQKDVGLRSLLAGGGSWEFESLRDYASDDEYRRINWKATARRGRPIVARYQLERAQNVVLVLENGKRMAVRHGSKTGADWAVEAALLVAFLALRSGDRVGLLVFSTRPEIFLPPSHGHGQYNKLLNSLATLSPSPAYADYRLAVEYLKVHQPRRSLMLFFGDLTDEAAHASLAGCVRLLVPAHLPLFLTFRDEIMEHFASRIPDGVEDAFVTASAREAMQSKRLLMQVLRRLGVSAVDCRPEDLAGESLNRYLALRRSGKL